jgi:hypothetical protein
MGIIESVSKRLLKTTPSVWVSRLAIYSKLSAPPIRDVALWKGLNIIWAEEPDSDDDKSDVAGHSAGKTSFCRLLRYVLGENTFANKSNTTLIKNAFPNGYVGAELVVNDVKWAVLRPLGDNRASYVLKSATIYQLIEQKGESAYQENYCRKIGLEALLDPLASATVVRTNEPIRWGHLLAWCTRDQEARFQNVFDWRSPRSQSDWPAFRFPKSDPLFVMRMALGLFLPDELKGEEELSDLQRKLEKEQAALEVAKKEPAYWRDHYDENLRRQLTKLLPEERAGISTADIVTEEVLPDLKRYTDKAMYLLEEQIQGAEAKKAGLQEDINLLNERISANKQEVNTLSTLFKLEATAEAEATAGLKQKEELRRNVAENKNRVCPVGDVLIGECSYVLERQQLLKANEIKDAHALEQMEAKRAAAQARIHSQQKALNQEIRDAEKKRSELTSQQERLSGEVSQKKTLREALETDLENLLAWKTRLESPDKYAKLASQATSIDVLKGKIAAKEQALNRLLAEHDANRDLLSKIFSTSARNVLPSANYDGEVKMEERELHFQITHGGAMSGEAMETLAVLLSDISCLIYNSFSERSYLPGFLLHDSPREADLGLRLYRGYFRFAAQLVADLEAHGGCPFQYIITTTTPPPKHLSTNDYIALRLDASKESELLFRRDLSRPPEKAQMELV